LGEEHRSIVSENRVMRRIREKEGTEAGENGK
jgi:hypothetical protein